MCTHVSINATCIHFSRHGTVTGASHPRGRLSGLERHAGETAVAPLVVQGPQVRAALIEGMRPSAAVCGAAASGAGGVACLGLVTDWPHVCFSPLPVISNRVSL